MANDNFGAIPSNLEIPAGKTLRRNLSGTGFETVTLPTETTGGGTPSSTVADLDGQGSAGLSNDYSRGDHKHRDSSRHSNANDPTEGEKSALGGTSGIPGATNKFVTNDDARNTDARPPRTHSHVKADVGLGNVDNTTDLGKPISTATQTALDAKLDDTQFSGLLKISVGTATPVAPSVGDLWIDTN